MSNEPETAPDQEWGWSEQPGEPELYDRPPSGDDAESVVGSRRRLIGIGVVGVVLIGLIVLVLAPRHGNEPEPTTARDDKDLIELAGRSTDDGGRAITSEDYGVDWPLTIDGGTLRCEDGAAILETPETTYALNAEAQTRELGQSLAPVWAPNPESEGARMSTRRLIEHALALC